jgi:hypothetical protein
VNAGELIDYTRTLAGGAANQVATGHLLNLLNIAQDEVSREAKLPRRVATYNNLIMASQFALPADARRESVIAVYAIRNDETNPVTVDSTIVFADSTVLTADIQSTPEASNSRSLPVYDYVTASRMHPNWTTWDSTDEPRFVIYDPAFDPDYLRPVPAPSVQYPQSFRVVYVLKPAEITSLESVVFDGKFTGLHTVLAYRVAFLVTRDVAMLREYERAMNALAGQSRPASVVAQNPLYRFTAPGGARG